MTRFFYLPVALFIEGRERGNKKSDPEWSRKSR